MSTLSGIVVKKQSLNNFDVNSNFNLNDRILLFQDYAKQRSEKQRNTYRVSSLNGSGAKMKIINPYNKKVQDMISFVSNDYLGFSKHPKVIEAGIKALKEYGSGAGASPLIGGQIVIHDKLENKIANFFQKEAALTFTSGFASNSGVLPALLALLGQKDIAILDTQVHASVIDGCTQTNKKFFLHNDVESLESVLKLTFDKYVDKIIVVDGVYSQDGDIAPIDKIVKLAKEYGAYLIVDDAHGVGIFGKKGRGVLEEYNLLQEVDLITGTFSKTFGTVGGYIVGKVPIINYLKYYSRLNIFSAAQTPQAVASIIKGIDLLEEEPIWQKKINANINYFRKSLQDLHIDYGNSKSAIFPIMIRDEEKVNDIGTFLFNNGIYVNPITQPAVKKRESRLRMSILATHEKESLDITLNLLEDAVKKYNVSPKIY